jgi:bifunctional enzyme CysN/CysC
MHGVSPGSAAPETLLRLSVYAGASGDKSALIDFLISAAGVDLAEDRKPGGAQLSFATAQRAFVLEPATGGCAAPSDGTIDPPAADLSIVVVDAAKGLTADARRHIAIARAVGSRHVVLAVNGLDRAGWDHASFQAVAEEFIALSAGFDFASAIAMPVSAATGDNIAVQSSNTPWYKGPTLLAHLERVPIDPERRQRPLRLLIEGFARDDGTPLLRGKLLSGSLRRGDEVKAALSGATAKIARIIIDGSGRERATAGDDVAIALADNLDAEPGEMLVDPEHSPHVAEQFAARLVWLGAEPLLPSRDYLLHMGGREIAATVTSIKHRLDVETLRQEPARTLQRDETGACTIATAAPLALDAFADLPQTGRFTLYDRYTHALIAAGTVDFVLRRGVNIHMQPLTVSRTMRASLKGQVPCILWFTGLSGAGKSTIANLVEGQLAQRGSHTYLLDGDNVRHGLNKNLGFTDGDRVENIRRVGEVAKLFVDAGLIVLCSFISPFRAERAAVRDLVSQGEFVEVFVHAPLDVCERRDPKGLYAKSRAGELPNFTGIDSPYEEPEAPDLVLDTTSAPAADLARRVIALLEARELIAAAASNSG